MDEGPGEREERLMDEGPGKREEGGAGDNRKGIKLGAHDGRGNRRRKKGFAQRERTGKSTYRILWSGSAQRLLNILAPGGHYHGFLIPFAPGGPQDQRLRELAEATDVLPLGPLHVRGGGLSWLQVETILDDPSSDPAATDSPKSPRLIRLRISPL